MEIKLTIKDWLSYQMSDAMPLKLLPVIKNEDSEDRTGRESMNAEKEVVINFLIELKNKRKDVIAANTAVRESGVGTYVDWANDETLYPFPEGANNIKRITMNNLKKYENKEIYLNLQKNNGIVSYYDLIKRITGDISNKRGMYVPINLHKNEDSHLSIFRHAIMMCLPSEIQSTFECLSKDLLEAYKIDSKEEMKKRRDEISADFHKSLRQIDPFGNPHSEMIIYSLLEISRVPFLVIESIVQETNNVDVF